MRWYCQLLPLKHELMITMQTIINENNRDVIKHSQTAYHDEGKG